MTTQDLLVLLPVLFVAAWAAMWLYDALRSLHRMSSRRALVVFAKDVQAGDLIDGQLVKETWAVRSEGVVVRMARKTRRYHERAHVIVWRRPGSELPRARATQSGASNSRKRFPDGR